MTLKLTHTDRALIAPRFWSKVQKTDGCWLWIGARVPNGYGSLGNVLGRSQVGAHRVSWLLNRGPIPKGMMVCHTCDVRLCIRPDHLFLGGSQANMLDASAKGRIARGSRHGWAKLDAEKVREIRALYSAGVSSSEIGERFGIHYSNVWLIVTRKRWRHVL